MPDETEPTASTHPTGTTAQRRRLHAGRKNFQDQRRGRDQELVPRLLDVRDHFARTARCARRAETLATAHPLRDARAFAVPRTQALQMRENLRRHLRQLPSAWRSGDLSDAGAHGAAVGDARKARGRQGQFRFRRKRSAGGDALHRGAADASRRGADAGHGKGHGGFRAELRRAPDRADGFSGGIPESARQRRHGHRGRHGHEHGAAQSRRSRGRHLRAD